ncbi:MAG: MBL fold metallo-hydrolase [Pseudolabrys sp.]|nr:MBL fold metallo-hydrolase [Pseudolabrys sp.]
MAQGGISVRFWGVRGSIPCPGPATLRYGGNTACVEMRCGNHVLIFDAGSGIRALGAALLNDPAAKDVDILFSHGHIDHLIGLPFFEPLHRPGHTVRLWAGRHQPSDGIEKTVKKFLSHPLFPIGVENFQAKIELHDFQPGNTLTLNDGLMLRTAVLNHPGGATGYRIDFGGRSVAYVTDLELGSKAPDQGLLGLARDADLLIIDATYTNDEMPAHTGWGHSSWQQVLALADQAGAAKVCLFHHDPDHDDEFMDRVAVAAAKVRPGTMVAREGLVLDV